MATNTYNCLYGTVKINVPDSVEDFDTLGGKIGLALETAIKYVVYHKTLGEVREDIVEACVKAFDVARLEIDTGRKRKADGSAILVDEDADAYVKRLFAEKGWDVEAPPKEYLELVANLEITFDPSAKERERKAKVLAKMYLEAAKRIIANGNQAKWASEFGITLTGEAEADAQLLGWGIKGREDAKRRELEAQQKATYV